MIVDRLENAQFYRGVNPLLWKALEWLRSTDLAKLPLGKVVMDGERLFALVQEYTPKAPELGKFEAHRRYWDVQYVASGVEQMGWANLAEMTVSEPHSLERDVAFFTGSGSFIRIPAGSFAIFSPQDVHMPGVSASPDSLVRKIVVKVEC